MGKGQGTAKGGEARHDGGLGEAAASVEAALRKFDELVAALKRAPLESRKHIERAARTLQDAAENQEACGAALAALATALGEARQRNEESARALAARATEIQARAVEHDELTAGLRAIAQRASALNADVKDLAHADASTLRAKIEEILRSLDGIATASDELRRRAHAAALEDVAREADALHQTLAAAKKKLAQLAPS